MIREINIKTIYPKEEKSPKHPTKAPARPQKEGVSARTRLNVAMATFLYLRPSNPALEFCPHLMRLMSGARFHKVLGRSTLETDNFPMKRFDAVVYCSFKKPPQRRAILNQRIEVAMLEFTSFLFYIVLYDINVQFGSQRQFNCLIVSFTACFTSLIFQQYRVGFKDELK